MFRRFLRMLINARRSFFDLFSEIRLPRIFRLTVFSSLGVAIGNAWQQGRVRNFLLGLPAIFLALFAAYLYLSTANHNRSLSRDYWRGAGLALKTKDYPKAQLMLNRVMQEGKSHTADARFALAKMYEDLGDEERAAPLFRLLAPDGKQGFPLAHQKVAFAIARDLNAKTTKEDIDRLRWHLQSAGESRSSEMAFAWGRYSVAVKDLKSAKSHFEAAVQKYPQLWKILGELETNLSQPEIAIENYRRAAGYLSGQLAESPEDQQSRIDFAQVLLRLGRFEEAKQTLEAGFEHGSDEKLWNKLLAALYVNVHDAAATKGVAVSKLLGTLAKALSHDPNSPSALKRLMQYSKGKVRGDGTLRQILARVIADSESPSLAHLAMGNVCWLEGDKKNAEFHFDLAMSIQSNLSVVMNNMAWLIAHDEESPEFDRALGLVEKALSERPEDPSFLDTRGTIYYLRNQSGDLKRAASDLEKAVKDLDEKAPALAILADVYAKLGQPEIAEQFAIQAETERKR